MKKIFTLIVVSCIALAASAQYYYIPNVNAGTNPGSINSDAEYPVGGGLPAGWTTNLITPPNASPAWSSVQTIPFAFSFNGSAVTQYKVSTSGVLTFDVATPLAAPSYTRAALPNAAIPNSSVCIWGLGGLGANDYIITKTFGTAPNRQLWIQFSSFGYATTASDGSNFTYWSIVLEETTNYIDIVDNRTGGYAGTDLVSAGVQINSSTAISVTGSPNLAAQAGTDPLPADNTYYRFVYGTQPNYDMAAISSSVAPYLVTNQAPFSITGTVRNLGATAVTSFTMNYSVNSGPTVSGSISSVNIPFNTNYNFTHPTQWTPATSGIYNIVIWASNINGNADQNTSNDNFSFSVNVVDTFVVRQTCIEVFTSSTCGPCAPGNANMDNNVVPNISNYTIVKYQQDFPGSGDPYYTTNAVNRRAYYNINSIPRLELDGQWDGNAQLLTTTIFNNYQAVPAFMTVDIASATYTGTTVNVQGTITPHVNYGTGTYRYQTIVTEKMTFNNVATNLETDFNNVMMKMNPTETGTVISSLTAGTPVNFNQTITLPASTGVPTCCHVEEMSDLRAVIIVQNNTDKKVLQSAWRDIVLASATADIDAEGEGIAAVYPNPANESAMVKISLKKDTHISATVTNIMGQVVSVNDAGTLHSGVTHYALNTAELANGVYHLTLTAGNKTFTQKFMVQH
jgi:hypothetical protein